MKSRASRGGGIRFSQGTLRDEAGRTFTEGREYLDRDEAQRAAAGRRVLVHSYHAPVEDITGNRQRLDQELLDLRLEYELFKSTATLYADGADSILVFERHH